MIRDRVVLRFSGEKRVAPLRELTGRDEYAISGASTSSAIELLDALLDEASQQRVRAADLVAADRDRLLAAVYARAFGDRIESTITCTRCEQPFDLHFSLQQLMESVDRRTPEVEWKPIGGGRFEAPGGATVRLLTGSDELAASALSREEMESFLRDRANASNEESNEALAQAMDQIAPLLDLELVARCAECGHVHVVQFDIQRYTLGAILAERRRLLAEINRIAIAYAWRLDEILSLTRTDRRILVELIDNERVA
jgi:hypothetical protein